MKPAIGLSREQEEGVGKILNTLLSDEYILYTKTRNYHWNVVGPQFNDLHKFFEAQYEELNVMIDDAAERARAIGAQAFGTVAEFSQHTRLTEQSDHYPEARGMVANLLSDHETVIHHLRVDLDICAQRYRDAGTSDFLTGVMEQHEKMAWMLRAYLVGE